MGAPNQIQAPILELGGVTSFVLGDLPDSTLVMDVSTPRKLFCLNSGGTIVLPPSDGGDADQDTFPGDYVVVFNGSGSDVTVVGEVSHVIANGDMSGFYLDTSVNLWRQAWVFPRFGGGGENTIEVQANGTPVSGSPFSIINFLGPDVVAAQNGPGLVGVQPDRFPLGGTLFHDYTTDPARVVLPFTTARRRIYVEAGSGEIELPLAVNGDTYEVIVATGAGPVEVYRSNGSLLSTVLSDQVWVGAAPTSGLTTWITLKRYDRFAT